jgi:hypothetical protein
VLKALLVLAVLVLALVGLVTIGLLAYVVFAVVRFNRRNPHARDASIMRRRADAQIAEGAYDDGVRIYRELRELVTAHLNEPELIRYLMGAAETIARTAASRRDLATATELFRDAQEVTHVAVMPVLRELLPAFLRQDRGKALVCVELLARLAERYPKQTWIYWSAKRTFSNG